MQKLGKIAPFGEKPNYTLHWFGLTDGFLWIDAGGQTLYEYNDYARKYFGISQKYNDYQLARFLEDFFHTFKFVGESVPEALYDNLELFESKMEKWYDLYDDEPEEVFDKFYFKEYCALDEWYSFRAFDSGHLVGGPNIGCYRYKEKIKILWKSDYKLDNKKSIWTSPRGCLEMSYGEFVSAVTEFFEEFRLAMDKQVENAVNREWKDIFIDKELLLKENIERKIGFLNDISLLEKSCNITDWEKVTGLYFKMIADISQ